MTDWSVSLMERLEVQGPIDLYVEFEEYPLLRQEAHRLWLKDSSRWASQLQNARLFLAFLRGYTFYRELPENDMQFWSNFHAELGIAQLRPEKHQYDALWQVLHSDPRTAAHCHVSLGEERDRREFVRAIREAWGFRSLSARALTNVFVTYYNTSAGEPLNTALLQQLLPAPDEATLRQVRTYDRIFRALTGVVDHLLVVGPELARLPAAELSQRLREDGLNLGEPNVVSFLAHKSEMALWEVLTRVRPSLRRRLKLRQPRRLIASASGVQVRLAAGFHMAGAPVVVRVQDLKTDAPLQMTLEPGGSRVPVHRGAAVFGHLLPGTYTAVSWAGETRGPEIRITVLPPLTWTLGQRPGPVLEGEWSVGKVESEDGRFATFRWRTEAGPLGTVPPGPRLLPMSARLDEDLQVEFELEVDPVGVRLVDRRTGGHVEALSSPHTLEHLDLRPLVPRGMRPSDRRFRAYFESKSAEATEVIAGNLSPLAAFPAALGDRLIIETRAGRRWRRVAAFDHLPQPQIRTVQVLGLRLSVECEAPTGATLRIQEQSVLQASDRTYPVPSAAKVLAPFLLGDVLAERKVNLTLLWPDGTEVCSQVITVDPARTLSADELLITGLGWGQPILLG